MTAPYPTDAPFRRHVWQDDAACATADPSAFYPEDRKLGSADAARYAKTICALCPVVAECLAHDDRFGIRGGLTSTERGWKNGLTAPVYPLACKERIGTDAGGQRHRRAGEPVCPECLRASTRTRADNRVKTPRPARAKVTVTPVVIADVPAWVATAHVTMLAMPDNGHVTHAAVRA
jgi:hypothetical protein